MAFSTIQGSGGAPDSFVGTSGVDSITFSNVTTPFFLGAQEANDSVVFGANFVQSSSVTGSTLKGGAGNDIFLDATVNGTDFSSTFINGNSGADTFTTGGFLANSTLQGGQGTDALTLNGAVTNSLVNGNRDADTITVAGATTGSSLLGGQGNDTVNLNNNVLTSLVSGDEGDDAINLIGAGDSFAGSTIGGGAGNDTINATAAVTGLVAFGEDGNDSLAGNANADTLDGGAGTDTIDGGAGADALAGGADNDLFIYNVGDIVAGETLDGGAGTNTARATGGVDVDFSTLTTATLLTAGNIQNVQIDGTIAGSEATFLGSQLTGQAISFNRVAAGANAVTVDVDVTTATAVNLSTLSFTATGTGAAFVSGTDVFRIDGDTNNLNKSIVGPNVASGITTGGGNDTVSGGAANDTITGGLAADSLTGGLGNNRFGYTTAAQDAPFVSSFGDATYSGTVAGTAALAVGQFAIGNFEVITDIVVGSTINTGNTALVAGALAAAAQANDTASFAAGTWNAATRTFTVAAAGPDTLLMFDSDPTAALNNNQVILVGVTNIEAAAATAAVTGIITF